MGIEKEPVKHSGLSISHCVTTAAVVQKHFKTDALPAVISGICNTLWFFAMRHEQLFRQVIPLQKIIAILP
jgi:hypothetical protein